MIEADFARIERELGIVLPTEYRSVMTTKAVELERLLLDFRRQRDNFSMLYFDADRVIEENLNQRGDDAATGYAFPNWEQTFVLVGDNGAGDYFCLRLDNSPGVWVIGSDSGDEATQTRPSLEAHIQTRILDIRDDMGDPEQAVAVPFLTEPEWKKLRANVPDPAALGETYPQWEVISNDNYRDHRREKRNPRRIWIETDAILSWCRTQARSPDAEGRRAYAEYQLEAREPWLRSYRNSKRG